MLISPYTSREDEDVSSLLILTPNTHARTHANTHTRAHTHACTHTLALL